MKNFNKAINRTKNMERKWSKEYLEKNFDLNFKEKFYNLSIADLDFESPKEIRKALIKRVKGNTYSYTYIQNEAILAIESWYKRLHKIDIKKDLIKIVHGTVNAMFQVVKCFTVENENILIQSPIYQPFERSIQKTNRKVIYNELVYKDNNYYVDFEKLEKQIRENNIKLFLWCNPHNPGGRVWDESDILKIIEICNKYNVLLFSDEVHGDLVLSKRHKSILNYRNLIKNFIVCNSPNKAFNLGGLKGSYMICSNTEILEKISSQYEKDSLTSPNIFYQPALIAAYSKESCNKWLSDLKIYIKSNFNYFKENFKDQTKIEIMDMNASYLIWIKLNTEKNDEEIKKLFLKQNLIPTFSFDFANCERGWVRINIGINKKSLAKIVNKFKKVLEEI